ncbi:MAG: peptidylprolyl isomerase [Planctomycetota bacterium]|jgi:cyclophilin family peptidyl-prolyl cis-trans isomerase/metal-dependent hydrolase (beta-lactamase superfamily II)
MRRSLSFAVLFSVLLCASFTGAAQEPEPGGALPGPDDPVAVIETNHGMMVLRFFTDDAPDTCKHFMGLVEKKFYDRKQFYRVVKGHVIQAGNEAGSGPTVKLETNKNRHIVGAVGMARSEHPDSATSEFYICHAERPKLDGKFTVFAQIIRGYDTLDRIANVEVAEQMIGEVAFHRPRKPVVIERMTIRKFSEFGISSKVVVTVLCGREAAKEDLATAPGTAYLVTAGGKTILFDAGPDGSALIGNMKKLGLGPETVDAVVLSRAVDARAKGVWDFLVRHSDVPVFVPKSTTRDFTDRLRNSKVKGVTLVRRPVKIAEHIHSAGELGRGEREQFLVVKTAGGLILLSGGGGSGLVDAAKKAQEEFGERVCVIVGGFGLDAKRRPDVPEMVAALKKLGVKRIAPSRAVPVEALRKAWGDGFIDVGSGAVIEIDPLGDERPK